MLFRLLEVGAYVLVIGILVTVHEFGHFWVARRLGFKVLRFSVGFGRPLWTRVGRDGVEYVLSMIPLGGYVRLLDERDGPVAEIDRTRSFGGRPVWARIAVLVAGAGANFVFAVLVFWGLFLHGVPGIRALVAEVRLDSVAASAGLRVDDEITAVAGRPVAGVDDASIELLSALVGGSSVTLDVRRAGGPAHLSLTVPDDRRRALTEPGALEAGLGFGFVQPKRPVVVGALVSQGPAALAGLLPGDTIETIDGRPVADFSDFRATIGARPGGHAELTVRRGATRFAVDVPVRAETEASSPGHSVGRIGIVPGGAAVWPPGAEIRERYGVGRALIAGVHRTWQSSAVTLQFLLRMVTGDVSLKNVSGPFSIANVAAASALAGFDAFLALLAGISVSLGVFNLLPVPLLDGGQVVYQLVEAVKGGAIPERIQAIGQQVGIAILVLLMGLAVYNDLSRLG
jgi:regulator of sigma E protease